METFDDEFQDIEKSDSDVIVIDDDGTKAPEGMEIGDQATSYRYYQCSTCWTLTSKNYLDSQGNKCHNCEKPLLYINAPEVELDKLQPIHNVSKATSTEAIQAKAYDPQGIHFGYWYDVKDMFSDQILPTPVALVQSRGPGDALRFLHAASRLLYLIRSRWGQNAEILAFVDQGYMKHIVGLYSQTDVQIFHQDIQQIVYKETIGNVGSIYWTALKGMTFSDSVQKLRIYLNDMLQFLADNNYRWYSPTNCPPVILEPYHGKTRQYRYDGIRFARIDLNTQLMEHSGYLNIPHTSLSAKARPPNTVRVLLYVRDQETEPERNTPWLHFEILRDCQTNLQMHGIIITVTLAGMKNKPDYAKALNKMGQYNFNTVHHNWKWDTYCYGEQSYGEQFRHIMNHYDVAIGINTSALDLAAAAGLVTVRDREWRQKEYTGVCYNLFLLAEATYGIFITDITNRMVLYKVYLFKILMKPFSLPKKYLKLTRSIVLDNPKNTEQEIGSLD